MKSRKTMKTTTLLLLSCAIAVGGVACAGGAAAQGSQPPEKLLKALKAYQDNEKTVAERLEIFRQLDFDFYSHQLWDNIDESHTQDIEVHNADGTITKGLPAHIEDMKKIFVWAPDTRVSEQPVKFGTGEWTAAIGVLEGTFTKPMPIGDGKVIQPTGKAFRVELVTIGHWTKDNLMDKEYLFWDNQQFMKQIGLAK